jgi:hypothetical protein
MPVYFLTLHAFRSWNAEHRRGWMQRGKPGLQPTDEGLARHRDQRANHPPARFDTTLQPVGLAMARDLCEKRNWRLHGASVTPTHIHLLVSCHDAACAPSAMAHTAKRLLGMRFSQTRGTPGAKWFARGHDERTVKDREHFDYLMHDYLPKHRREAGTVWLEHE